MSPALLSINVAILPPACSGRRPLRAVSLLIGVCSLALLAGCSGSADEHELAAMREPSARQPRATSAEHPATDSAPAGENVTTTAASTTSDSATSEPADSPPAQPPAAVDAQLQEDLIRSVIDNFNRLDEFDPNQIFPQLRARLNQWMWQSRPANTWQRDPLLDTLDPSLSSAQLVAYFNKNLEKGLFDINDMVSLQEAVWERDIAKNARGNQLDELSIAEQLFDWTVRNLQLVEDPPADQPAAERSPAEILLLGRATARERAWIFLLLLRQQGLDGAVLAIPGEDNAAPREWVTALITDKDLFLFDPWLGMPIPGPEGHRVATLAEVAADDGLLRKLDLSSTHLYPAKADQLSHLIAYVEASPTALSRRMETLEARLTGDQRIVLTAHPQRVAERLKGRPGIDQVRYWSLPYEFWKARGSLKPGQHPPSAADLVVFEAVAPLIKGRMLHFKGVIDGKRGAKDYYLKSRVWKDQFNRASLKPEQLKICDVAKQDASYWLGLIAFEQQNYSVADDYFSRRTLKASPEGPWTDGAHYNLGRTYEASGDLAEAIKLFQADRSPQNHGNRLRARRLKAQAATNEPVTGETPDEKKP